ncbi:MAG: sodium-translocating pyrophosphatase [Planctomycetota bacterium]|nr:sodium-translocating pyrophosphatase [Planctomycetota bacterium]
MRGRLGANTWIFAALAAALCGLPLGAAEADAASATAKAGELAHTLFWLAPVGAVCALFFAFVFYKKLMACDEGNEKMKEIAQAVREGAYAYLYRQYKVVGAVFLVLVVIFTVLALLGIQNPFVPVAFLTGGFFSGLCGYLGMKTATSANSRTAQGATVSLNQGLQVAFRSGAVMGLVVVGFGLLDIVIWYILLNHIYDNNIFGLSLGLAQKAGIVAAGAPWDPAFVKDHFFQHAKMIEITTTMITFGMGASTQALFARVGGGIYTKAADVGADLVGKVEAGIPEDDPRNPATIADNVGDNVGDVAGMGADLYESYCGSILATAALGAAIMDTPIKATGADTFGVSAVIAPLIIAGIGNLLSIIGIFAVRTQEGASQRNLLSALLRGTLLSSVLILAATAGIAALGLIPWGVAGAVVVGLLAGVIIGQATEYYTSDEYTPTKGIAYQAQMGPATTIIDGIGTGMYSTGIPVVTIVVGILLAYGLSGGFDGSVDAMSKGLYGVSFAAVGMLATLGITLATDAYGPIADNAGGNAEMAHLGAHVRERTDALDSLGNTTAATGKGFAIGSAALTAMALLAAYLEEVRLWLGKLANNPSKQTAEYIYQIKNTTYAFFEGSAQHFAARPKLAEAVAAFKLKHPEVTVIGTADAKIADFVKAFDISLMNPMVICGLFLGGMMAYVFCAMAMKAVGRAAGKMVEEVRRQFKEKPGIMQGTEKPDYARCVAISTAGAQREMILPSLLAIIVPVVVGMVMGVNGVMGLLAGGLTCGFVLAVMLNNSGGAWDNAKKHIERGNYGGKYLKNAKGEYVTPDGNVVSEENRSKAKNPVHGATVIGDTVGDPFKDTAGPSLNILIKLMTMVSVVFAGLIVAYSLNIG